MSFGVRAPWSTDSRQEIESMNGLLEKQMAQRQIEIKRTLFAFFKILPKNTKK